MKLELESLRDLLRPLRDRVSIEGAVKHFVQRSGFDWFCYRSGLSAHCISLSTYPPEWRSKHDERGYATVDPVLRQVTQAKAPFCWSTRELLPHAPKAVVSFLREARCYGIRSGFTIPIEAAYGRKASLTFASMKEAIPDGLSVDSYTALSTGVFIDNFLDMLSIRDGFVSACPLTRVQLECLSWVAEGKANEDVAVIRGVTRRAVESQLNHIRRRLDVVTTCQAVAVAIRSGWL